MTGPRTPPIAHLRARLEIVWVTAGLLSLVGAQLVISRSLSLFSRHFWLDEILTQTLVADRDLGHALGGLAGGIETHPPGLYLLLRGFTWLAGGVNEVSLRVFSLLSVLAALVGIYLLLRQSFSPLVTVAAVLAVWCHPLILRQAFEARFYAPWFAAIAWFAYFLARARDAGPRRCRDIGLAACALLVCTIHYLGVISLALVTGSELWLRRPDGAARLRGLGPTILGPVALVACIPLLLKQQTALTGAATWIDPPSLGGSLNFLNALFLPRYLGAVVLVAWLSWLVRSGRADPAGGQGPPDSSRLGGVTGLALMPVVLIGLSYAVKPMLVPRYGIPAVAALAPAVAFGMCRASRGWLLALCLFLVVVGARDLRAFADEGRDEDRVTEQLVTAIRRDTDGGLVVFETQNPLFRTCYYAPDLADRCRFLDFELGQLGPVTNYRIFNRDLARNYQAFYGKPGLAKWEVVRTLPRFYLVRHGAPDEGAPSAPVYPGFSARRVSGDLYLLRAAPRSSAPGTGGPDAPSP